MDTYFFLLAGCQVIYWLFIILSMNRVPTDIDLWGEEVD